MLTARADHALEPVAAGPVQRVRVLLRTPRAAYLGVDDLHPVCGLVDSTGLLLPDCIALPAGTTWPSLLADHLDADAEIMIGGGLLRCGRHTVRLRCDVDTSMRLLPPSTSRAASAIREIDTVLSLRRPTTTGWPSFEHRWSTGTADLGALESDAPGLIGRGPGLTPSGDDILAAALFTHAALGTPGTNPVGARIAESSRGRTTAVSTLSLRAAAQGRAVDPLRTALTSLVTGSRSRSALIEVLSLGHSSGADLVRGMRDALAAATQPAAERKVS